MMGETIRFILIFVDCMLCDSDDCGRYGVDEGGVVGVVIVACLVETQRLVLLRTSQENTKEIFTDSEASEAFTKATAATRHLAPDTDSCAAAIEALFACGAADAAEMIYSKCRSAFLPNPALYSAVIFGRLSCGNGQGATDAMLDMHSAGFVPHQRFLSRCLRLMGPFCQQGLLLIDRLGLDTMQRKLLHVLMEACNASFDPASSILEVYQFLKQKEHLPLQLVLLRS
jgi:hypothetical protein